MSMNGIKINLLPWRAERRLLREESFKKLCTVAAIVGVLGAGLIYMFFQFQQNQQSARNSLLQAEINKYKDTEKLMKERAEVLKNLVDRINVIKGLHGQRTKAITEMETLAAALPENLFLYSLDMQDGKFEIDGMTLYQNSDAISKYLNGLKENTVENTEGEPRVVFDEPTVRVIQDQKINSASLRSFSMDVVAKPE